MNNSFGNYFSITTAGESHGPALVCIVDGCPANLLLTEEDFVVDMQRRRPGQSQQTTQRQEADQVEILSGVFEGKTTGAPIALLIKNTNAKSKDYTAIKDRFRPGHADFTYQHKYGHRDYRGGGRASARETALWVAAGVIAKKLLQQQCGMSIESGLQSVGAVVAEQQDFSAAANNDFNFLDAHKVAALSTLIKALRRDGDSVGGVAVVRATAVPIGLGEPIFNKLDAAIAQAMMTINAVKGVAVGGGFQLAMQRGTLSRDALTPNGFEGNQNGGVLGGISTGQDIEVSVAFKPTASITTPIDSTNTQGEAVTVSTKGRHDPCVAIRGVVVAEAMLALVLADFYLQQLIREPFRGQHDN